MSSKRRSIAITPPKRLLMFSKRTSGRAAGSAQGAKSRRARGRTIVGLRESAWALAMAGKLAAPGRPLNRSLARARAPHRLLPAGPFARAGRLIHSGRKAALAPPARREARKIGTYAGRKAREIG